MNPFCLGLGTLLYWVRIRFAPGVTSYGPAAKCNCSIPDEDAAEADGSQGSMPSARMMVPAMTARLNDPPAIGSRLRFGTSTHIQASPDGPRRTKPGRNSWRMAEGYPPEAAVPIAHKHLL